MNDETTLDKPNTMRCNKCGRNLPPTNQYWHWDHARGRWRKPCKECRLEGCREAKKKRKASAKPGGARRELTNKGQHKLTLRDKREQALLHESIDFLYKNVTLSDLTNNPTLERDWLERCDRATA